MWMKTRYISNPMNGIQSVPRDQEIKVCIHLNLIELSRLKCAVEIEISGVCVSEIREMFTGHKRSVFYNTEN